jgi:hypothetical protein
MRHVIGIGGIVKEIALGLITIFVFAITAFPASAQLTIEKNTEGISLRSVLFLNQPGVSTQVISGKIPANTDSWSASVLAKNPLPCSGTLIGPKVLLLAAHCVGDGKIAKVKIKETELSGPCTWADDYRKGDESADYALCRMTTAAPDGIMFETVSNKPDRIIRNKFLTLTGYGCNQPHQVSDEQFRVGVAKIVALPGEVEIALDAGPLKKQRNLLETLYPAWLCKGDSGGGCYLNLIENDESTRRLVCVNVADNNGPSYMAAIADVALAFMRAWSQGHEICGINLTGPPCHE